MQSFKDFISEAAIKTNNNTAESVEKRIQDGFSSQADKKRALTSLSVIYSKIYWNINDTIFGKQAFEKFPGPDQGNLRGDFIDSFDIPMDFSNVREKNLENFKKISNDVYENVKNLLLLRQLIKDSEVAPPPPKKDEERVNRVKKFIIDEMERKKTLYAAKLDVTRAITGGDTTKISVYARAHLVYGHKGAKFLRTFYYLDGKVTSLNQIISIVDTLEREDKKKMKG